MRVWIGDPALLGDLAEWLRDSGCVVEEEGPKTLRVSIPKSLREDAARLELALYLSTWQATRPVEVEIE